MSQHTHAPSTTLDDAIAAMALGALDASEQATLDAQLAACAACREQLAELQRAVTGIGLSLDEEPPASLRAAVMANARSAAPAPLPFAPRPSSSVVATSTARSSALPWLAAAACLVLAGASSFFAMMSRQQASDALREQASTAARATALQSQVASMEARLNVMSAPDVKSISLQGQPDAPGSSARVFMSAQRGLVINAEHLPALANGRSYQLWVVTKQAAVSIGLLAVQSDGSVTGVLPLSADATVNPVAVAITIEPAGGVPAPTGPKVLVGLVAPQ
jgi:anti-sigma factor RsiW